MARRILQYLERIDQSGGRASRMDFLRIAGNEANLDRMAGYLIAQRLVVKATDNAGRVNYSKTDLGEKLHALLKGHEFFGSLLTDLGRSRLGRS